MIEHFRNFGAMTTAREFWGGNNGFVTIAVDGVELPVGATYETAKAAHEAGTATEAQILEMVNRERNLFNLAQALGQRAVVVAVSELSTVDATAIAAGTNSLAFASAGTPTATAVGVTFLIERADVLTEQPEKPGTNGAGNYAVDPIQALVDQLTSDIVFSGLDTQYEPNGAVASGTAPAVAAGAVAKVYDALPVLIA